VRRGRLHKRVKSLAVESEFNGSRKAYKSKRCGVPVPVSSPIYVEADSTVLFCCLF